MVHAAEGSQVHGLRLLRSTRARGALASLVLLAVITGCGGSDPVTDVLAPTSSPAGQEPAGHEEVVGRAVRQLDRFVDRWAEQGWDVAARRHLMSAGRPPSGQAPDLRRGRVTDHELRAWRDRGRFELLVTLDLRFAGSPGIWQQGENDVFLTVRPGKPGPYRFRISSGPAPAR